MKKIYDEVKTTAILILCVLNVTALIFFALWASTTFHVVHHATEACAPTPDTEACALVTDEAALLACRQSQDNTLTTQLEVAIEQLRQRYRQDEPEALQLLESSQATWKDYQRAECQFKNRDSVSGSAYQVYLMSCMSLLSEERLKIIKDAIDNP